MKGRVSYDPGCHLPEAGTNFTGGIAEAQRG